MAVKETVKRLSSGAAKWFKLTPARLEEAESSSEIDRCLFRSQRDGVCILPQTGEGAFSQPTLLFMSEELGWRCFTDGHSLCCVVDRLAGPMVREPEKQ